MTVTNLQKQLAEREAAERAARPALPDMIHSGDFVRSFVPPDYLINGVVQKKNLYAMTGMTGAGKSAILLRMFAHVALGLKIGARDVVKSRCLYLAGENPDDIAGRWIKQCEDMEVDPKDVDVFFIKGVHNLSNAEVLGHIRAQSEKNGPFGAVGIDTSAAFFTGEDDNNNVQAQAHAAMMRAITDLPGDPAVITPSHPLKHPNMENLLPKGGGAFLNAIDGNLVVIKLGSVVELYWHGKFRGPDFTPIPFKLAVGHTNKLVDSQGRQITTVTAVPITQTEAADSRDRAEEKEEQLTSVMKSQPGGSMTDWARMLSWVGDDGRPNKSQVQRTMNELYKKKLADKTAGKWELTPKGKKWARAWGRSDPEFGANAGEHI